MKKTVYIFIIFILFSCGNKKPYPNKISDFRPELQIPLNKLQKEKNLYSIDTIAGNFLKENCSKEELLKLLECEDPLLRFIAYKTIINRKEKDYFEILLGHLNDTSKVFWSSGDLAGETMVSDLLIKETSGILTQNKKNILMDSVLLKHSYLENFTYMLQGVEPKEKYYSIIKKRCEKKDKYRCGIQLSACFALSKFKKNEDLEFLKNKFNNLESPCEDWIFKSIEQNPNEIYFPILEKYFYEIIKKKKQFSYDDLKYYCRAIAKYQNKESLALLTEILEKKNYPDTWYFNDNQDNVFRAIHKYKAPIYEDLYRKLKPKMSEFVMKYLDSDLDNRKTW
ncbi:MULTISPECIES: hypothetical protein [unclassified Flavobacterium]|uniref:hypothetical protein n=1 Tax=unclassified Flavobacterium TaxID=196869 RepID=UPI003F8EB528